MAAITFLQEVSGRSPRRLAGNVLVNRWHSTRARVLPPGALQVSRWGGHDHRGVSISHRRWLAGKQRTSPGTRAPPDYGARPSSAAGELLAHRDRHETVSEPPR